jgi:hypothetical protein
MSRKYLYVLIPVHCARMRISRNTYPRPLCTYLHMYVSATECLLTFVVLFFVDVRQAPRQPVSGSGRNDAERNPSGRWNRPWRKTSKFFDGANRRIPSCSCRLEHFLINFILKMRLVVTWYISQWLAFWRTWTISCRSPSPDTMTRPLHLQKIVDTFFRHEHM